MRINEFMVVHDKELLGLASVSVQLFLLLPFLWSIRFWAWCLGKGNWEIGNGKPSSSWLAIWIQRCMCFSNSTAVIFYQIKCSIILLIDQWGNIGLFLLMCETIEYASRFKTCSKLLPYFILRLLQFDVIPCPHLLQPIFCDWTSGKLPLPIVDLLL